MAKQDTTTELPLSMVEIKTSVTYKGEVVESAVRIDVDNIAKIVRDHGGEAANKSLKKVLDALFEKTGANLKSAINK